MCVCAHVHACVHACVCVCVCIHHSVCVFLHLNTCLCVHLSLSPSNLFPWTDLLKDWNSQSDEVTEQNRHKLVKRWPHFIISSRRLAQFNIQRYICQMSHGHQLSNSFTAAQFYTCSKLSYIMTTVRTHILIVVGLIVLFFEQDLMIHSELVEILWE